MSNYLAIALIAVHNQSTEGLRFKVPWVPTIPALSIVANVALMVNLNPMTWVRFGIWMSIGLKTKLFSKLYQTTNINQSIYRFRYLLCIRNETQQRKRYSNLLLWFTEIEFPHRRVGFYSDGQRSTRYTDVSDRKLKKKQTIIFQKLLFLCHV